MDIDTPGISKILYSLEFQRAVRKLKKRDRNVFARVENQIAKIIRDPSLGKPLRYTLKNRRRIHVGSFVLVYELHNGELRFIDFDHHDRIYKKHA